RPRGLLPVEAGGPARPAAALGAGAARRAAKRSRPPRPRRLAVHRMAHPVRRPRRYSRTDLALHGPRGMARPDLLRVRGIAPAIEREVDKVRRTPPSRTEVERAKQQVRSWARYEQDGVTFQGMLLSAGEGIASWDFGDRLLAKVEKVRAERIRDVARTYLV